MTRPKRRNWKKSRRDHLLRRSADDLTKDTLQTFRYWQRLGRYEHEVVADYRNGCYVPGSHRYSGRYRPVC